MLWKIMLDYNGWTTTLFMVFSVTYTIYEGPKLDSHRSQSVKPLITMMIVLLKHK